MKRFGSHIISILIVMLLLLTACTPQGTSVENELMESILQGGEITAYEDMVYSRYDKDTLQRSYDRLTAAANEYDLEKIMECVFEFYDEYDRFYTSYSLADLKYCHDLTDKYWQDECDYYAENIPIADAMLENMYYELAASPCREALEDEYFGDGFFESYDGENIWNDELQAIMSKEALLQNDYYAMYESSYELINNPTKLYDKYADEMTELLIELVKTRNALASYMGYDSYVEFAEENYYSRDYDKDLKEEYFAAIAEKLSPMYCRLFDSDAFNGGLVYSSEKSTFEYLREAAENMGGEINKAFHLLETAGLYDISYGENKYDSAFEIYLFSYAEPFIFINSSMSAADKLTLAHEFGHFCSDYISYGNSAGADVAEIFSQGMEYLSLCYTKDNPSLIKYKMADSLCTYVEQAAYADFEQRLYEMPEEELTVENVYELYRNTTEPYGFVEMEYDSRELVLIQHFYTNPMYVISYVLSNDAAMQIYEMELEKKGSGKNLLKNNLDTDESILPVFMEEAGLQSPFEKARIEKVKTIFEEVLF